MSGYTPAELAMMFTSPRRRVAQGLRVKGFRDGADWQDAAAELTVSRYLHAIAAEGSRRVEMSRLRASLRRRPEDFSVAELKAMLAGD